MSQKDKHGMRPDVDYRAFNVEFRIDEEGKPKIYGYAAVFDKWSEDLGGFREIIRPGAFAKTIKEADVRALFNHDPNYVLGRTKSGTLELAEDKKGLAIGIDPPDTQWVQDLTASIDRGDIDQMSFGFRTIKDKWNDEDKTRELLEVGLVDVSPVTYPAYPQTSVSAREHIRSLQGEPVDADHSLDPNEPVDADHSLALKRKGLKTRIVLTIGGNMKRSDEKRQERAKLVKEARVLLDVAEKEDRKLTAEEDEKYDRIMEDVDKIQTEIESDEKDEQRRKHLAEFGENRTESEALRPEPEGSTSVAPRDTPEYRDNFRQYLGAIEAAVAATCQGRALQMDADVAGGYTVVPQEFVAQLIEAARNRTIVRGLATTFSVPKAQSLGAPALDNRPGDLTWTAEILTGSEDSTMSFGKRELYPHPLARRLKVSKKLVRASALNIEAIVRDQLGYKCGVVEENAFLNGSGAGQPLGVFTASDDGISTGRDVSTDNTTTEIRADGLIEAKYTLKANYWGSSRWIFHRDAVKQIRKLKDGEGQYIWRPGLANDRGDTILDAPVLMSEYAPNTFTAALYVGILGDFSNYWIADALDMTIQVLTELYAEANQNGYIIRKETDGMPVLEEAFVRVKLAAS